MPKRLWLYLSVILPLNLYAHDIEVQISGKIKDSTCDIVQTDRDKEVQMGDYRLQDLLTTGISTNPIGFTIGLENCGPETNNVKIAFTGNAPTAKPELLALDSGSVAQLGIRLLDKNKNALALNNTQDGGVSYPLQPGQAVYSLQFYAQYVVLTTPVPAGPANATANLILTWP